ncbi:uncharacterized protein [Hetaerina americana]|uniref:uncharacterized protein isoform X2 n=1 Tax=Hetaerina americana TaxID=62018 RepID=UPI003A7F61FF
MFSRNHLQGQFLFKCNKSNVPVPFSGYPFRREKNITYQCAFGSQYYGKFKKQGSSEMVLGKCEKRGGRVRHSKKLGCKAKMAAKCIRIYLGYKIPSESSHWRLKKEVISNLKQDLMSKEVKSLSRYFVKISDADQHCHSPMHPKAVIRKLVEATKGKGRALAAGEETFVASSIMEEDMSFETTCMVKQDAENLIDLRELCRQKGKEVATLSQHLCHDETQLRDLLAALTRVTDRLSESQLEGGEMVDYGIGEGAVVPSDVVVLDSELCFPSDVSQTVVVEGEDVGQVLGLSEDLELGRSIYVSGDTLKLDAARTEEERFLEEVERSSGKSAQSMRLSKRILASPGMIQNLQKRFSTSVDETELGLQLNGDLDDSGVIYYVLA